MVGGGGVGLISIIGKNFFPLTDKEDILFFSPQKAVHDIDKLAMQMIFSLLGRLQNNFYSNLPGIPSKVKWFAPKNKQKVAK